jgi:chromosome partitioning protein
MKTIAFFNNKKGSGKTSLVYHLAWMYAELEVDVITVDLDPQADLTSLLLDEKGAAKIWPEQGQAKSLLEAIQPALKGGGDIKEPYIERISERLGLIAGDLGLSVYEDQFSNAWQGCAAGNEEAFRVMSAFYRMIKLAAEVHKPGIVFIDVGPNLGAITRAAMITADYVIIPLLYDFYWRPELKSLGPRLRQWRKEWKERLGKTPDSTLQLPSGVMKAVGYIPMLHSAPRGHLYDDYRTSMKQIPGEYRKHVLDEPPRVFREILEDPYCLAVINHYISLIQMAIDTGKPMFHLKPADGAIGSHAAAVRDCFEEFKALAVKIAGKCGINIEIYQNPPSKKNESLLRVTGCG